MDGGEGSPEMYIAIALDGEKLIELVGGFNDGRPIAVKKHIIAFEQYGRGGLQRWESDGTKNAKGWEIFRHVGVRN